MGQKLDGIVFHGSGGLLYYYMGIAEYIQNYFDIENLKYCGVSGGCIPAFILSIGIPVKKIWNECFIAWINEKKKINSLFTISVFNDESIKLLIKYLKMVLSQYAEEKAIRDINNKLSIRMSKVLLFGIKQEYINKWSSFDDLLDCIIASCWVPAIFGSITRTYKGSEYIDGGFPKSIEDRGPRWLKIKVNTFQKINEDIKVLLYGSSLDLINSADIANKLYKQGYKDAEKNKKYFSDLIKKK